MSLTFSQTNTNPINNSPSKQLYSFPKASRFSLTKQPLCSNFYDTKNGAFSKRSTSFGHGCKSSLSRTENVPAVGKYQIGSLFNEKHKNKGFSFSRVNRANSLINPEKEAKIPGPGTYNHSKSKSVDKFSTFFFTIRPKIQDTLIRSVSSLGPGQYQTLCDINKNGKYYISKYLNSGCGILGKAKRKSINEITISPGPGFYKQEDKNGLNNTGIYFNSKYRNMQGPKIGKSNRPPLLRNKNVPGPGQYSNFTEFGTLNKTFKKSNRYITIS